MTAPNPSTVAEAYQDLITALGDVTAAFGAIATDPDVLAALGDLGIELSEGIPSIIEDIFDIAICGAALGFSVVD